MRTRSAERRLFFLLHRAHRSMLAHVNTRTQEELGISASQLATLLYIAKNPRCSMTDVASMLDVAKSAASGMLHRMELAGFIAREPNPRDARGSQLGLTARGEEIRAKSSPVIRRVQEQLVEGFDASERETIFRFLNAVVARYGDASGNDE